MQFSPFITLKATALKVFQNDGYIDFNLNKDIHIVLYGFKKKTNLENICFY